MPVYAAVFLVMTMSSIGLPTLNGFIGEFLILQGVFVANKMWAAFAASGVVLGAAYMLYLYQRTMFGKIENPKNEKLMDLNGREFATFAPLIVLAVWMGLYPKPFLDRLDYLGRARHCARESGVRARRIGRLRTPPATSWPAGRRRRRASWPPTAPRRSSRPLPCGAGSGSRLAAPTWPGVPR